MAGAVIFPFSKWAIAETTRELSLSSQNQNDAKAAQAALQKLDSATLRGEIDNSSVIEGQELKARSLYRAYLKQASVISDELLDIRKRMQAQAGTITLSQLGALVQSLSSENKRFKQSFTHGEEKFQSYRLIEKALTNLEDSIHYWRLSNHFRTSARGGAQERVEDDEILKVKLQTALNAIQELERITATRKALTQQLFEE